MTIEISLSAESEAMLRRRAAAEGKALADFVRDTIEEKLASEQGDETKSLAANQGTEAWLAAFHQWSSRRDSRRFLADDSREAIYSDEAD